jgi:hypothetical protein
VSEQSPARRAKRPRGIILLVLLFYTAAALVVISILATSEEAIRGDIGALITLCLVALAWGLWKLYRWAWFATLIMFVFSTVNILSGARLLGTSVTDVTVLAPLGFIAVSFVYLISPNVRGVYLKNGWIDESPA